MSRAMSARSSPACATRATPRSTPSRASSTDTISNETGWRIEKADWLAAHDALAPDLRAALELAAERIAAYHVKQKPEDSDDDRRGRRAARRAVARGRCGGDLCPRRPRGLSQLGADERDPRQGRGGRAAGDGHARPPTARSTRWCSPPRISPASTRSGGSAARRRSRRSPTAPGGSRRSMSSAAPAMPGSPRPSASCYGVVGIDMVAGPSEIVVVADGANDPQWIAADLLSQAEHDPSSQSILFTDDAAFARAVADAVDLQIGELSTAKVARASWDTQRRDHRHRRPGRGDAAGQPPRARASRTGLRRCRGAVRPGPACRIGVPRPPHARSGRRLCRRAQPRPPDRPPRALFERAVGARFHEAHQLPVARRSRARRDRPGGGHAGRGRGAARARQVGGLR